jgi:hypothetical protein
MKSKITILILLFATSLLSAQTVNIQGDPYSGNPYATITDAITASTNPADVILITGVHTETITINKSITLRGTDPSSDIIQAAGTASSDGTGTNVINVIRDEDTDVLNVTIENLGVRNGNADSNTNGGGINVDKVTGLLTLKNLIVENNHTSKNGGAMSFAGSNVDILECTIRNNTSSLDGGAIIAAPNNAAEINSVINIKQSLINTNTGRNGGGIYVNGNNQFGNNYTIDLNIENSTISNNSATSASGGAGGGAIWTKVAVWTTNAGGDGSSGNINLSLVHATVYNNTHAASVKTGLRFTGTAGITTNFSAYNSIIVSADDVSQKVINFTNSNTTDVVNCILGGLEGAGPFLSIIDDTNKNNLKGRTATQSGLTGTLSDEGGNTQVIAIADASAAIDFCSASTGITLPTIDQRGAIRTGALDAGAFELGGTLSTDENLVSILNIDMYPNPAQNLVQIKGFDSIDSIKIYSVLGAVERTVKNQSSFDVTGLASGIHIVVIKGDNSIVSKRLIVK